MNEATLTRIEENAAVRNDALDKVGGTARYTFDVRLPGMLHAKILRSPHAHARITRIDAQRAARAPGVAAAITRDDLAGLDALYGIFVEDQPVLAFDKVRYVGDSVAAVAAEDEVSAYRALPLIDVEYEVLPPLMTIADALGAGAPPLFESPQRGAGVTLGAGARGVVEPRANVLYEFIYETGNLAAAFADCDHVFEDSYTFPRITHFHLEPHVAVARVEGERIELWTCNQDPFTLRQDIARIFRHPEHRVRVYSSYVGGGFGGKSFCKIEPLCVLLAKKAGRPVRLCLTMDESMLTLSKHAAILTLRTGVKSDGTLVCRDSEILLDAGAYADVSPMVAVKAGYRVPGPYRWRAVRSRSQAIRTTCVPAGSFRGYGGTQAGWASESQIDTIARQLGFDPYVLRAKNLLRLGEPFKPGDSAIDSNFQEGLDSVVARLGYHGRKRSKGRGMGLAIGLKDGGGHGKHAQAIVKVLGSGHAKVQCGTVELGQGATTVLCRIAAEVLKIPLTWTSYGDIDTDQTPLDPGTHVSSATTVMGRAVMEASEDARRRVLEFSASQLGCQADEIDLADWIARVGDQSHPVARMIAEVYGTTGFEFIGRGQFKVPTDAGAPINAKTPFWIPSWCGAEVEVDEETGRITLLKLIVAGDCGRALNLPAARGQIEGGAMMGLGLSLFESLVYNGERLVTATPLSYRVPLSTDLPDGFESIVEEQGHGPGPFGVKGIGEGGILAVAPAIANAVEDAIGVRITELPLTPERVLAAVDRQKRSRVV